MSNGPNSDELQLNLDKILDSSSYRLAELDTEFLQHPECRPVRMQLELLKAEKIFQEEGVRSTIVVFGGTQLVSSDQSQVRLSAAQQAADTSPDDPAAQRELEIANRVHAKSRYYDVAREFGRKVSSKCQIDGECDYVVMTGGGPGIMEAANRGAFDVGAKSIGLNIILPDEQNPNPYITPELCFQFHYFAIRKFHFLLRAKAVVIFPGGFGTLDELFDALTLRQVERMQPIPIILVGREYWDRIINFQALADEGVIRDKHLELIHFAEGPEEIWQMINDFHSTSD